MKDRIVVVTGAAAGIGRATAERFENAGAVVLRWDRDEAAGKDLTRFRAVDVADVDSVEAAVDAAVEEHGRIDVLINNAGIVRDSQLIKWKEDAVQKKMSDADFDAVIGVNLRGVFLCTRAVAPHMIRQRGGVILNASSVVGLYGNFGQTNYVATKAGVIAMTRTWARELGRYGIRVNAVAPGFIGTEILRSMPQKVLDGMVAQTPLGRMGEPADIAEAYLWLASDAASFVHGTVLSVDGGLVPGDLIVSDRFARIVSTGCHVPPIEVTNDMLRERFAESAPEFVDKMESGTGITRRWYAPDDQATSDIALPAARQALERAGVAPEDVDLIVLGTDSPDYITPATSVVLQHKLGARNAGTFDVGCACASFPTGLAAAAGMLAANPTMRTALVVGAYAMQKLASHDDPTVFFYGDGAGAAVLQPSPRPGFVASAFLADGAYHRHWGIYAGGTAEPATVEAVEAGRTRVQLVERYPPEINHEGWPRLVRDLARRGGFSLDDIDLAILTQVRKSSIELVMKELGLPMERAHTVMEKWGYTGSACIPMALHDAVVSGRVKAGDLVVMVGSGVGYNQAATAFRITDDLDPDDGGGGDR